MALSTGLIRRLDKNSSNEPLAKRLKLAENAFYSPDLPIVHKEDCIFRWLCSELSDENIIAVWITIHRCLVLEPKNFSRLSPEIRNLLIEKLIITLNEYPENNILEEMLNCCTYIFLSMNIQSNSKENRIISLMKAVIIFSFKVLNSVEEKKLITDDTAIKCTEQAIVTFAQACRKDFNEKGYFITIFIEELLFPLALVLETLKNYKVSSRISMETQKCVKRLLLSSIKNITLPSDDRNEKIEETEMFFSILKNKVCSSKIEEIKAAFTCLFQCATNTFQQNSTLIDIVLRKLIGCINQKEQSKQVLTSLLENSVDISYNFDYEIDGISFKDYLLTQVKDTISKEKRFKYSDYELLSSIAKLNPLIIEDVTQNILERILFENRVSEKEKVGHENLIRELWKASVRLRRQHKFLSKFLLSIGNYEEKEVEALDLKAELELPQNFITEFNEDLKNRTTNAQILAMFHTLIYHLKTDCIGKFKSSGLTTQVCLSSKTVSKILVMFFENSNFLDNSLSKDWQMKFYHGFIDLRNNLALFTENLCENSEKHDTIIFVAYFNIVKIWCKAYDLLNYYIPNIVSNKVDFPINEFQMKELKKIIKKCGDQPCKESMNQLLLFKSVIYDRNNPQQIKENIILELWSEILENHFEITESFDANQILKLASQLVNEACSTQNKLIKWTLILKRNISRMTKLFATAVAFQIIGNIVEHIKACATKTIVEKTDFEKILKSLDDQQNLKKSLKSARKEISKLDFKSLNSVDFSQIKRSLMFMSHIPLSFLDMDVRAYLFMVIYTFEEECKCTSSIKEFVTNLYLDFLRQNDVDVLNSVYNPLTLINHFKEDQLILSKIFKISLSNISTSTFLEDFVDKEDCDRKISSVLLTCLDITKNKVSNEHKTNLQNLSLKLSNKITKKLPECIEDPEEMAGLRISLKLLLVEKKELKNDLKMCIESTLKRVVENSETIVSDKLIHESLQLSLIVLSHRENFNISEDIIKRLCIVIIENPDEKYFFHFLEILKDSEFEFFAKSLVSRTRESLTGGKMEVLEKITTIWDSLSKAESKGSRSKSLCNSVNNLFNNVLNSEIKVVSSVYLLKICRAFVTSKRMIRLSDKIVDSVFVTSMECLNELNKEAKLITCQEALGLCLDFLRSRTEFLLDRLPALTNLFRKIIQIVLLEAKESNFSNEQSLRILAVDIEKFCTFFAKLKKDVARISPYLIADLIEISSRVGVLPSYLKMTMDSSMSHLLSNCDRHAVSFLSRTLPTSMQQIFKTLYDNYTKYHKFTGKI